MIAATPGTWTAASPVTFRMAARPKSVLITGAAGFFGSHLVEHLLKNTDWDLVLLVRMGYAGNLKRLTDINIWPYVSHRVRVFWHDLRSPIPFALGQAIGDPTYIIHAAAESHVDRSIEDPRPFVESNIIGTLNLMQWALHRNPRWFLYFSTDEVYGPMPEGRQAKETDAYNATNPYAASKAGAEQLVNAFGNTYGLPVFTTNTMNLFGERQHPEKFIPKVIRACLRGETVPIHANADRTKAGSRFYIHCRNAADAILFLLTKADVAQRDRFNIVGEREVDNLTLAQMIAEIVGLPLNYELVDFHSSRPGHDLRYALDGSKLAALGWSPPKSFEESLERTVHWTLERPEWLAG